VLSHRRSSSYKKKKKVIWKRREDRVSKEGLNKKEGGGEGEVRGSQAEKKEK